jgi:hypothetical protein
MASVIDGLPQAQRQKVIDALLAGQSLRKVAKLAGVSHTVVDDYKRKVFTPTLNAAQKLNAVKELAQSPQEQVVATTTLTRAVLHSDPLLARIAEHQQTVDAAIGFACDNEDPKSVAALISTDLKGLELHARLTGRLESQQGPSVAIQIVCPAGAQQPTIRPEDGGVTIDITGR